MAIQFCESWSMFSQDVTGTTTFAGSPGWSAITSSGNSHAIAENSSGRFSTGRLRLTTVNSVENSTVRRSITSDSKVGVITSVFFQQSHATPGSNGLIRLLESGTLHVDLRLSGSNFVVTRNGTTLATGTKAIGIGTWYGIELYVEIADSGGKVKLWIDGAPTPDIDFTGDTRNGGSGVVNQIDLGQIGNGTGGTGAITLFSDTVVYDDSGSVNNTAPLGDLRVEKITPNGAGASTQFTPSAGSNFQCVDEGPYNSDTDFVASATVGHKDLYAMGGLTTSDGDVLAVQLSVVHRKTDAGTKTVRTVYRAGDGTEDESSDISPSTTYSFSRRLLQDVPGGTNWTMTDVNDLQVGVTVTA